MLAIGLGPARNTLMIKRIFFGALMIVAVAGLLWLDGHLSRAVSPKLAGVVLMPLLLGLIVMGFLELRPIAVAAGAGLLLVSGLVGSLGLPCLALLYRLGEWQVPSIWLVGLLAIVMAAFGEQMSVHRLQEALGRLAGTTLTVVYLGGTAALIVLVRLDFGLGALTLFLAATKFTDIGAYFTGSAMGRHKLIAWLSPGKSWEGLAGGLVTAALVCVLGDWLLSVWLGERLFAWPTAAAFGLATGLAGQFGDLCESLLKRSARRKDSAALIPEFGGVLDILDSVLFAAPVSYVFLWAVM